MNDPSHAPLTKGRDARALRRPLDVESAAILGRLTEGLTAPSGFGLISRETGSRGQAVRAERLSEDRYLITRVVELDTRTEDPEVYDRAAAPEVEFVRQGGDWVPVAARRGAYSGPEHDPHDLAVALLRLVAHEHSLRPRGWLAGLFTFFARKPRLGDLLRSRD